MTTVGEYEKTGGFKAEFLALRNIGLALTTLEEAIPCRPHTSMELKAFKDVRFALENLRSEMIRTRDNGGQQYD